MNHEEYGCKRAGHATSAGVGVALSYAWGEWARVWPLSRLSSFQWGPYFSAQIARLRCYRKVLWALCADERRKAPVTQCDFPKPELS